MKLSYMYFLISLYHNFYFNMFKLRLKTSDVKKYLKETHLR